MIDVSGLCQAYDGVDQDIRLACSGSSDCQLSMRSMHRVASLEGNHPRPPQFVEMRAKLCGSKSESDVVIVVESTDGLDLASDVVVFSLREQVFYGGMFLVTTKNLSCLLFPKQRSA